MLRKENKLTGNKNMLYELHHDGTDKSDVNQLNFLFKHHRWLKSVWFVTTVGFKQRFWFFFSFSSGLQLACSDHTHTPFFCLNALGLTVSFGTIYFVPFREFTAQKLQ